MKSSEKITIMDVAKQAGVSIATVSRIINRSGNVKDATRQKVLAAMEQLGYLPDGDALTDPGCKTILLSIPEFKNPFISRVIDGVQVAARRRGYYALAIQTAGIYTTFEDYQNMLKNFPCAGVMLISSIRDAEFLDKLSSRCPVVMCSEYCESAGVSFVSIDDIKAAKTAVEYLVSIGRKKIALMNSLLTHKYSRHREVGFRQAVRENGLELREDWVSHLSSISFDMALSEAMHVLSAPDAPDAYFAISDVYAAAILKAANKLGLSVPQDVSIVGFDNIDISLMTDPAITTMKQPSYQMGYQACEILIDKIENPAAETRQIFLETELIVRGSTM